MGSDNDKVPNKDQGPEDNLDANELLIETSGRTFQPKSEKTYRVQLDVNDRLEPKESDRYKDQQGNPTLYWPISIKHVNGRLQTWNTNKTNASTLNDIKRGIREGKFKGATITKHGTGQRGTTWDIKGIEIQT